MNTIIHMNDLEEIDHSLTYLFSFAYNYSSKKIT